MDITVFQKQIDFLEREERIVLFDGGIGCGKTSAGALWLIQQVTKYPKTRWFMVSRDHKQLRDGVDFELRKILDQLGLKEKVDYLRKESPSIHYAFYNGSSITGGSQINYDSLFRGPSVSGILMDELDYWYEEAFKTALGRVRVAPEKVRCLTSPKGFSFVYDYFYKNDNDKTHVINATSYDNPMLSEDYIESLKDTYGTKLFKQEVLGERLNLSANQAFYEFDKERHLANVCYDKEQPIYIGMDFNVDNHSAVAAHYVNGKFLVFDEFRIQVDSDSYKMAKLIKSKYGVAPRIIPDSTGIARSTKGKSDFAILKNEGFTLLHVRNPHIIDRVINTNRIFSLDRILIDKSLKYLIRDLDRVSWGKNGKLDQTTDKSLTHAVDSLGYLEWKLDPIRSSQHGVKLKMY